MTRLLGLEIAAREVRVARGERSFGALRLTALERRPLASPAALPEVLGELAQTRADVVLTALPAASATHRFLTLPFRDRGRLARTAPLELLGQLPLDPAGLAVACEPLGPAPGGSAVLAAAVRRDELEAHGALLAGAGLAPARVDLAPLPAWNLLPATRDDQALVVADGGESALALRRGGRLAGLRPLGASAREPAALASEVRWSLAALGGAPATVVVAGADAGQVLARALAAATGARVVPLAEVAPHVLGCGTDEIAACAVAAGLVAGAGRATREGLALGGTEPAGHGSLRRAAALAGLALTLGALDVGLAHHRLARRDAALVRALAAEAAAALPGARLVAPRAQLEAAAAAATRRAARLGGETGPLEVLRELSARVPHALRLDLDELAVERDSVLLHGRAESFDAVDALRRALAASPLLADVTAGETRTTVDGRGVEFRLRAARKPALGASS